MKRSASRTGACITTIRKTRTRITGAAEHINAPAEVAAIEAKAEAEKPKPEEKKIEGIWGWLITYWKTTEWSVLSPRTKADYQKILDYLFETRRRPLTAMTPAEVIGIRNKAFNKHKHRGSPITCWP